ncbi:MAG TPA: CHAP domain-containing protein [Pseudonocardiaceae bacterium]|nr:CHAP domain-containing protein [Pseudonocardiaceae bacterium]
MREKRSMFMRVICGVLPLAVASFGMVFLGSAPANATTADQIVSVARSQIGVQGRANECNNYGPCADWCAFFAEWVWRTAGVSPVPTTGFARGVGAWGVDNGSFIAVGGAPPEPGDLVVYGPPQNVSGGHVAVVEANNGDGTIETIDGNDGNAVKENPRVSISGATAGSGGYHISGFVRPQNTGIPFTQAPGDYDNSGLDDVSGDNYGDLLYTDAGHDVDYVGNNINGNANHQPYYGSNSTGVAFGVPTGALTAAGDVSGDGYADLLDYDPSNDTVYYYPNNINAGDGPYATGYPVGSGLAHVAGSPVVKIFAADVTGDGHADLEYLTANGNLYYIPNNIDTNPGHTPYYVGATEIANGLANAPVTIGDVTGDHYADLVYYVNGSLYLIPNNILSDPNHIPFDTAGVPIATPSGISNPTQITASDITGDGYAGLLWANANGDVGYLANNTLSNPDHGYFETPSENVAEIGPGSTLI